MLLIQDYVSRLDTIRSYFDRNSWDKGISQFFQAEVPFSARNGRVYADRLVELLAHQIKHTNLKKRKILHVYELGAGLGLLSLNFLDILKEKYPEIYEITVLHYSDASAQIVKDIQTSGLFKKHHKYIKFQVIDITNIKFPKSQPPVMVFQSYLFDAIGARQIEKKDNQIYEILIRTNLPKSSYLLNNESFPPDFLDAPKIANLLKDLKVLPKNPLSTKIVEILQEQAVLLPLEQCAHLSDPEQKDISGFLKEFSNCRFNYNFLIQEIMSKVYSSLVDNGIYIISDFGTTKPNSYSKLASLSNKHQTSNFFSVFFPYLDYVAKKIKANYCITNYKLTVENQDVRFLNQDFLIHKGESFQDLKNLFYKASPNIGCEKILENILKINIEKNSEKLMDKLDNLYASLSENEKTEFSTTQQMGDILVNHNLSQEALKYYGMNIEKYGDLAISTLLKMGELFLSQKDLRQVEIITDRVLKTCPNNAKAMELKVRLALEKQDFSQFENRLCDLYKYSSSNQVFWDNLISHIKTSLQIGNIYRLNLIIEWLKNIDKKYTRLVSEKIKEIIQQGLEFEN